MDADVLLIEAARSRMELLQDWERTGYENEIGPGVYDIHSPRIPTRRGDGRAAPRGGARCCGPSSSGSTPTAA